jgi:hypothetical protein
MNNRGVTLIEILLSIIVMAIGMIGILALFPPTLQSSKISMEETHAAIVADSIKHSLIMGLKRATFDTALGRYNMVVTHDMRDGTISNVLQLPLPKITEGWRHYPGVTAGANPPPGVAVGNPETMGIFTLGDDAWVRAALNEVRTKNDPSDPYDQFAFSFDIRKINNIAWMNPQPNPVELEQKTLLFDFRVHVFRKKTSAVYIGGEGASAGTMVASPDTWELVTTVTFGGSLR